MVFRRRDPRPLWRVVREGIRPRGGYRRATQYIKHRLRRLPDSPEKIGRGMAAGVFISFTPLYGLHFLGGLLIAKLVRGNLLASLIGTFANNFLTIVPISFLAMWLGYRMLGMPFDQRIMEDLGRVFGEAGWDLWHNFWAMFTEERTEWRGLAMFLEKVFLPYLVGGLIPGLVAALASYWVTVPVVRAYQAARRRMLEEKLAQLRPPPTPPDGGPRPR